MNLNPDLIKAFLIVLLILLGITGGILVNAFCRPVANQREKYSAIALGIIGGFIATLVAEALKDPQPNQDTYKLLGIGYCFCFVAIAIFWRAWDAVPKEDDRTKLLEFIRIEVKNRLHAMGVFDQQISVRAELREETTINLLQVVQNLPGGEFIASTVKFIRDSAERVIPPGTLIIDIFNQEAAKKLLILGAPGSGKTTALLTLARQLHEAAEQNKNKPIPIVLELSSWQPSEEIPDWIALQLKSKYQLSELRCKQFLKRGGFVLLLDGLDELKDNKDACIDAINKFRTNYVDESQQLVVCSRLIDYEEATQKLDIPGCYALQPLSDGEIESYLTTHKVSHLWKTIKTDTNGFLELARQPLLLDLIRKTYADKKLPFPVMTSNSDLEQYKRDCQECLLADYVEHQLKENHHHRGYDDPQKTKHYLEWLAQNLKREKTTEFLLEKMQPSWLETKQQKYYRIATGIIIWLIIVLVSGLVDGLLVSGLVDNLVGRGLYISITGGVIDISITGVLLGIILGLTNGLLIGGLIFLSHTVVRPSPIDEITPYEVFDLKLSLIGLSQYIYSVIFLTILILISGLAIGLAIGLMMSLVFGLTSGLILGLMAGIMLSLIRVLHGNLRSRDKPNQGIWNSGKNGIIITVCSSPLTFATSLIISLNSNSPLSSLSILYVFMTPIFSLLLGIYLGGGFAFIQHFVLRSFLIRAGHIPRDYVGFLKYAEERGLILQNGGSFRFYHDLLREHLAGNP